MNKKEFEVLMVKTRLLHNLLAETSQGLASMPLQDVKDVFGSVKEAVDNFNENLCCQQAAKPEVPNV